MGLLVGSVVLQMTAGAAAQRVVGLMTGNLTQIATLGAAQDVDLAWGQQAIALAGQAWLFSVVPLMIVIPALGIGLGFAQGVAISFKSMFRFSNLNPMSGMKRLFTLQSLVTLGRSLARSRWCR